MGKVLIIGAGGVGTVVAHKIAQNPDVFTEIVLASRTQSKCNAIADAIGGNRIVTDRVNADKVEDLVALFKKHKPDIVVNVALPYQDLTIMDACLHMRMSIISIPPTMSLSTKLNTNINGSGLIGNVLSKPG